MESVRTPSNLIRNHMAAQGPFDDCLRLGHGEYVSSLVGDFGFDVMPGCDRHLNNW